VKNPLKPPWRGVLVTAVVSLFFTQVARGAPGEDEIQLKGPVKFAVSPGAQQATSGDMDGPTDIPAWMRARITRFTAKAFSITAEDGSIYTDKDVTTTTQVDGLRKTCIQEVGTNTVAADGALGTRYGPQTRDQVVVLRGDLVNVCR
jgi:hypothetical protein